MEKSAANKFLTPKFLYLGLLVVIIIGVIVVFLTGSSETRIKPAVQSPTLPPNTQTLPKSPPDKEVEGQIIVKFKSVYTDAQISEHLKMYNASILKKIGGINYTVVKVPKGSENEILEKLKTDPYVEKGLRDYTTHTTFVPNDPSFTLQYGLNNTGQTIKNSVGIANADVRAEAAWDVTKGTGVKIAILDTGINISHPDLAGKVIVQHYFTTTSIEDNNGHGTHVAGIIAASGNDGIGITGVCPECQLIIGKIMDDSGNGTTSNASGGITWAADQGAKVINMSIETTTAGAAPMYQTAIDYAISKGAVVVVAAGNDGTNVPVWPAANTNVVSVAATDNLDRIAAFSNRGTFVRVAAPGTYIYSTLPNHTNAYLDMNYGYLSGTSMASPLAAGVVALIWSTPYGTSPTAVMNRLFATADKITGTGTDWTEGRVNAAKAVAQDVTLIPSPTQVGGVPSPACVGGVGAPPCATIAQPSTPQNPLPSVTLPPAVTGNVSPSAGQPISIIPSSTTGPTIDPCAVNAATSIQRHRKHHRKHRGQGGGGIEQLFQFLMKLLEELLKMFGIQLPNPIPTPTPTITPALSGTPGTTTTPSPNPCVSPTVTAPTTIPSVAPSNGPSVTPPGVTLTSTASNGAVIIQNTH